MASRIVGGAKFRRMLKRMPVESRAHVVVALDEAIRRGHAYAEAGADVVIAASPVYSAVDRTMVSGGVYTVFVLGGPSPATGLLRQDR